MRSKKGHTVVLDVTHCLIGSPPSQRGERCEFVGMLHVCAHVHVCVSPCCLFGDSFSFLAWPVQICVGVPLHLYRLWLSLLLLSL